MNAEKGAFQLVVCGDGSEVTIPTDGAESGAATGMNPNPPMGVTLCDHESAADGAGVKVAAVVAGGRCFRAGLSSGDTLLSVGGKLVTGHKQGLDLLEAGVLAAMGGAPALTVVVESKYTRM